MVGWTHLDHAAVARNLGVRSRQRELAHLAAYDAACVSHKGGAYLREQGLYSSQVTEWRKQRDAGVLDNARPGAKVARLTPEQAEIARLRQELGSDQRQVGAHGGSMHHGKSACALGRFVQEHGTSKQGPGPVDGGVSGAGRSLNPDPNCCRVDIGARTNANYRPRGGRPGRARPAPGNKLSPEERAEVLAVLDSDRFVVGADTRPTANSSTKASTCVR